MLLVTMYLIPIVVGKWQSFFAPFVRASECALTMWVTICCTHCDSIVITDVHYITWRLFSYYAANLAKMFCISGQHKRSLSDVKEDATVSEGAEHGEWDKEKPTF